MCKFFSLYNYQLRDPVFKTFRGMMVVTSKAIYSKRVFQSLLRFKTFTNYWLTKGTTTSNNNFQFIFKEQLGNTINTNEYVQLNIQHMTKLSMLDNEWRFSFDGNRHDYMIPFISMLLSMIHFTSNLTFNSKFAKYVEYERAMLRFYTDKTSRNNARKSTDISLVSVAQRMITKKDVYNDSIASVPRTNEERLSYSGRSKPFLIHYFTDENDVTTKKWEKFFYDAATKENKLLIKRNTPQSNIRKCEVEFTAERIYLHVFKPDGTQNTHEIGAKYFSVDGSVLYWITYYPEKSNVFSIINHNNIWLRRAAISEKNQSAYRIAQSVRLRVHIPAQTENIIRHFTAEPIRKISFFEPYGLLVDETPREHLLKHYGDARVIIALCKQHMWDHSDDEIMDSLNDFDMKKHQDLIQNYMQTTVLYFEYNEKDRKYELAFPRHKYWYAYNYYYENVTFVFKNSKSMYEVVYFGDIEYAAQHNRMDFRHLQISKLIGDSHDTNVVKQYVKIFNSTGSSGYLKKSEDLGEKLGGEENVEPSEVTTTARDITYHQLLRDVPQGWSIDGQMFDSNGKSVGVRLKRPHAKDPSRESVVDIRFAPQFPIVRSGGSKQSFRYSSLRVVTDSRTNTESALVGMLPPHYQIIPKRTREVEYDILELSTEYEKRRQMMYYICRMIVTHWMIRRLPILRTQEHIGSNESNEFSDDQTTSDQTTDRMSDLDEYLEEYIQPYARPLIDGQRIDSIVIPMYFEDLEKFEQYLSTVMPNFFHASPGSTDYVFRVAESDVEPFRLYMKRELEILVNMNDEFYTAFSNARMHTIISTVDQNEIVDIKNIQELQTAFNIKKHLVDQKNYLFSSYFSQNFDIKSKSLKESNKTALSDKLIISKNTTTKTELLIIKVNGQYYMIRFTNSGEIETAVYICSIWKKYKKICSFWETESMLGSKRMFEVVDDLIVESHTNNQGELAAGEQDFHILQYKRDTKLVFAAMLPFS